MANTKRITVGPAAHIKTVRKLARAWDRATNAESNADTYEIALKLANASQRALTALRAAQNGTTVEPKRTKRYLAKLGLAALANIGKSIARAIAAKSALVKARTANVARVAARKVRISLRMALAAVVALALTLITTKDTRTMTATVTASDRQDAYADYVEACGGTAEAMEFENTVISAIGFAKLPDHARAVNEWTETNEQAVAYYRWLTDQFRGWASGGQIS